MNFYTSGLTTDTKFSDWVLLCARAMGPLVSMRDEPADAPIPETFKVSSIYLQKVKEAKQRLDYLESLQPEKLELAWAEDSAKETKEEDRKQAEYEAKRKRLLAIYERMLDLVMKWTPPSADHQDLKASMINQINTAILCDCSIARAKPLYNCRAFTSAKEWHETRLSEARFKLQESEATLQKERKLCEFRNNWLRELRESLAAYEQKQEQEETP